MAAAIRSYVPMITADVIVDEIEDKAYENGCLTEDDRRLIKGSNDRKKQVRTLVILTANRSYETMKKFLDALRPVYPYISDKICQSYKRDIRTRPRRATFRRCSVCQLKDSINVELVMDRLYSEKIINQQIYRSINDSSTTVGQQNELWDAVLMSCRNNNGIELLLDLLDETEHYTHITPALRNLSMEDYECTCPRKQKKNRAFSKESTSSYSPRESSDSLTSNDVDIARSKPETCHKSSMQEETTSASEKIGECTAMFDPLINTPCYQSSSTKAEESKNSSPDRQGPRQNLTNEDVKQQYVRLLSSPSPEMSPESHSVTTKQRRGTKRFKSAVVSAMVKLRVVKLFKNERGHHQQVLVTAESESETEL